MDVNAIIIAYLFYCYIIVIFSRDWHVMLHNDKFRSMH